MDKSDRPILDKFGKALMAQVRDESCSTLQCIISGKMADKHSKGLNRDLRKLKLGPEAFEVLGRFLVEAVDIGLANFLEFLDVNEIEVRFRDENRQTRNIQAISDGLAGELYSEDGWIEKFSKYKESIERLT